MAILQRQSGEPSGRRRWILAAAEWTGDGSKTLTILHQTRLSDRLLLRIRRGISVSGQPRAGLGGAVHLRNL